MFQEKIQISREKFEFWYSLVILLIVPVLIAANTLLLISGLRKNFDIELRRKAELVAHVIEASLYKDIANPTALQASIDRIVRERTDITGITVMQKNSEGLKVVGSNITEQVGNIVSDIHLSSAVDENQAVALLVKNQSGIRIWKIASPIHNNKGGIVGVQTIDVSLQDADTLISDLLLRSLVIMGVSVIIVVLLLLNHFRFVEYAMLFRKLREVDQLKDDFLSVATHELKAPMTVIKGNIENISDGLLGPVDSKVKDALGAMYIETERLNVLVNDLLNVSRIEQGRITYTIEPVNISMIIQKIVDQFSERAHAKNLEIVYEQSGTPVFVQADAGRVTEIMTNLIDNAIKYSQRGSVRISHKLEGKNVLTAVRDTGIGISAENRERLFNRFYRVKSEATKDISGTGLGLWIIKQYIEHMGGKIYVESMEGSGSEFVVMLPVAIDKANSPQISSDTNTQEEDPHATQQEKSSDTNQA